ncbi:hypothetical protein [Amycolatopsis sp. NPDC051716]|uniref:hypothetical protein n=1 Tax=Amycolatopsis sp. NPDC051716 TaxID=3155804 RepID=UPI00342D87C0
MRVLVLEDEPELGAEIAGGLRSTDHTAADRFAELNRFPAMRPCATAGFTRFDGHNARFFDDVGAWQSVEPADDFTATALLAFALAGR